MLLKEEKHMEEQHIFKHVNLFLFFFKWCVGGVVDDFSLRLLRNYHESPDTFSSNVCQIQSPARNIYS